MNRQIVRITQFIAVYLVFILLPVSCDSSLPVNSEDNGIIIRLTLPEELEVTTKGMFDELPITDVWVLQYSKETNALLKAGKYTTTKGDIATESKGTIKVTTSGFVGVDSYFYVIANGGDAFLNTKDTLVGDGSNPISVVNLKKTTKQLDSYKTVSTFATADSIVLTQDSIKDNGNKAIIVAPLERAFARVNVQWNKTETFKGDLKINDVKVYNVPKMMATCVRGGGAISEKYPEVSTGNIEDVVTISSDPLGNGVPLTFYMPENLRGMGTGTSFSEKNKPEKGPDGSLDGCTFILMSGYYKYPLGSGSSKDSITVQYKIYPGGNLTNDYNIQRGYSYDLKVNISGVNSADVRVTITDGRVAVFDDVVVMDTVNVNF